MIAVRYGSAEEMFAINSFPIFLCPSAEKISPRKLCFGETVFLGCPKRIATVRQGCRTRYVVCASL